ncbi:hypothetical protein F0562_028713 [Nyssa sinensis]|uniref:Uncharacterized protein n=1 Tax=Nyssa sinensis TaxID=561372 RepID=A0A5J5AYR7_9ASTE|nr:hypothetical protein F0562_028713 [Nyssa sinensis]
MARGFPSIAIFLLLLSLFLSSQLYATNARPVNSAGLRGSNNKEKEDLLDKLSFVAVKNSGPSPGEGHKYEDSQTLLGTQDSGPSPGEGHKNVPSNHQSENYIMRYCEVIVIDLIRGAKLNTRSQHRDLL